jgi:glycerol-3-phosphate dehydrogenase
VYYDGQFDDSRLAITLMRTAMDHGATLINHLPVTGLVHQDGAIAGVTVTDHSSGQVYTIHAKSVVNATGVFVDAIRSMDAPAAKPIVAPSQGIHIVVDRSFLPGDHAVMIPKTADGRVLFALPWHDCVVIGTTDTGVPNTSSEPRPLAAEIEFVLSHTEKYLSRRPQPNDIRSVFAGLRPLVKKGEGATKTLSRDHTILFAESGMMTITGGKWTTYRHMAEDAVDQLTARGVLLAKPCITKTLRLHGYSTAPDNDSMQMYGSDAAAVRDLAVHNPDWAGLVHPELPYIQAEVLYAVRAELACTVEDVLARRTRALLINAQASAEAAPLVAELMAAELGHDQAWQDAQVAEYQALAAGYQIS